MLTSGQPRTTSHHIISHIIILSNYPYDHQEVFIMAKIYTSADQLIGGTPLLELTHIEKQFGLEAKLLA